MTWQSKPSPTDSTDGCAPSPSEGVGYSRRNLLVAGGIAALGLAAYQAAGLGPTVSPAHAAIAWNHPFTMRGSIYSGFGSRPPPCNGCSSFHLGLDYSPPGQGTPIYTVAPGVVVLSRKTAGVGNEVIVDHGSVAGVNYRSRYIHMLDSGRAPLGAVLGRSALVGHLGGLGDYATGPHLHVEIHQNGTPINPRPLIHDAPLAGTGTPTLPNRQEDDTMLIRNSARGDFFATPGVVKRSPNPSVFDILQAGGMTVVTVVDANIDAVLLGIAGPGYTYDADLYVNPALTV
jgi:hypothetical protein